MQTLTRAKPRVRTKPSNGQVVRFKRTGDLDLDPDTKYLVDLNHKHSDFFQSPEQQGERQLHREQHPTEIMVSKCMDGRLHLPVMTETAMGIIQPMRNIGGKFDLGEPLYQEAIFDWYNYAIGKKRRCLKLITYHFSQGKTERGCRGFKYKRHAAQAYTADLKRQFDKDFGRGVLYAAHVGIETDLEGLILHGDNGETVDLADVRDNSSDYIKAMLRRLFPDMKKRIVLDFMPLIRGNIRHIAKIRADKERSLEVDAEHKEWVLGYGRGFDWLHEINTALIVGPFSSNRVEVIKQAAKLIYENWRDGRTNGHEIVLLSSAFYRRPAGPEPHLKRRKARGLEREALQVIKKAVPKLLPHLKVLTGVVDINTRKLEVLRSGNALELL